MITRVTYRMYRLYGGRVDCGDELVLPYVGSIQLKSVSTYMCLFVLHLLNSWDDRLDINHKCFIKASIMGTCKSAMDFLNRYLLYVLLHALLAVIQVELLNNNVNAQ